MKQYILILSFLMAPSLCFTQEILPCVEESFDTEKEMREIGVGKGETAFVATLNAVSYALSNIKTRLGKTHPKYQFIYETKGKSTLEVEQIEIETTLGQPNIICNEVLMPNKNKFIVYLVLSVTLPDSNNDKPIETNNN